MSYQTINPFTEKLVKTFMEQTNEQLEAVIAQADNTYRNDWSLRTLADRKKILKNAVKIFRERREELAGYITLEMGKLMTESRDEVDLSADILEYYADNAEAFLAPEKLNVSGGEAVVRARRWASSSASSRGTSPTISWLASRGRISCSATR